MLDPYGRVLLELPLRTCAYCGVKQVLQRVILLFLLFYWIHVLTHVWLKVCPNSVIGK